MRDSVKAALLALAVVLWAAGVKVGADALAPAFADEPSGPYCMASHAELHLQATTAEGHGNDAPSVSGRFYVVRVCDAMAPDPHFDAPSVSSTR